MRPSTGPRRRAAAPTNAGTDAQAYGTDPYACTLRARDLARKATLRPAEWVQLLRTREVSLGLPRGSLR